MGSRHGALAHLAGEWARLETGLVQRTTLLNLILADLYGPQTLLDAGLLPPSLVFSNPAFLRPCHGIRVPHGIHLHLHAVDLARLPDGQWWVLADRTQAPSGAGYALENRIVISRSLPETFRDCQVQRLASFFRAQRDALMTLAPQHRNQPKVVLLTPGPYNETYFEHAYLARYLGFTLVEGGDLTVRDRRVFIKTLDGLEPVDVIFRRLDDSFAIRPSCAAIRRSGSRGWSSRARRRHVTIANALGSGVIETAAIMAFLLALPAPPGRRSDAPVGCHVVVRPAQGAAARPRALDHLVASAHFHRRTGADVRPEAD